MDMSYADLAILHNDCNIGHTISLSNVTLSPNALENLLEKAHCLCILKEIIFHLDLENKDIGKYSKEIQLKILTRLAPERFDSTCFTDSDNAICISKLNVEEIEEGASTFINTVSQIPVDVKLHLACLANDHQCVRDILNEEHTTDLKKKNVLFYGISCAEIVDVLVNSGVDVNTRDERRRTPIFYALISSSESAKKLLEKDASVTETDNCHVSVLTFFADNMLRNHLPTDVKDEGVKLLSEKIDRAQMMKEVINLILCKFIQVRGTMQAASNPRDNYLDPNMLCETLRVFSDTIDGTHADDRDCLMSQLQSMQERITAGTFTVSEVLQRFDNLGADPSAPDSEGNTSLHYATQLLFYGVHGETVTDLCHALMDMKCNARVDAKNHKSETPLLFCLSSKHLIASNEALRNSHGCLRKVCEILMEEGSKLRQTNHKEESAFHLILKIFQHAIILQDEHKRHLVFEEMFEILSKFAEKKTNYKTQTAVRKRDIHLNTPLHLLASLAPKSSDLYKPNVCDKCSFEILLRKILDLLLLCGVLVDDSNENKQTPLHMCRTWTAVKLLLDAGAEPDVKDISGCTPLLAAAKRNTYIGKDSKSFYPDVNETPDEFWEEVLNRKFDPWTADKNGDSVLSILIQKEANCLAKALIETACDQEPPIETAGDKKPPKLDEIGIPLLIAICKDQSSQNHWKYDLVKLLLDSRRNLARDTLQSDNNDTPLHFSCRNILKLQDGSIKESVHWNIAQYLLLCGADVNAAGKKGESCLTLSDKCAVLKKLLSAPVDHCTLPLVLKNWKQSSQTHAEKLSLVARMVRCEEVENLYFYSDEGKVSGNFVFAGIDKAGREVAVKRIDKAKIPAERDVPEGLLVLLAQCDQIIKYYDFKNQGNFHYIAFELMEGNLEDYLQHNRYNHRRRGLLQTLQRRSNGPEVLTISS